MQVNVREALRYLGYRNRDATPEVLSLVESCAQELMANVAPKSVTREFSLALGEEGAVSIGGLLITSRTLHRHLRGCTQAVLFAATLGVRADFLLERAVKLDMSRAVVMQACAAALVEDYCDECEQAVCAQAAARGLNLRPRYSPGYGDFSMDFQAMLLQALDAPKRIGLSITGSSMLVPTKSVTAVIGLTPEAAKRPAHKCGACSMGECPYREEEAR